MTKRKRVQFGTLATMVVIALPIAVVVSCGSEKGEIFDFSKLKKHDSAKLKETIDKFKEWLGKNAPNEGGKITKEFAFTIIPPKGSDSKEQTFKFEKDMKKDEISKLCNEAKKLSQKIYLWVIGK